MKKILLITAAICVAAFSLNAQNKSGGINLSLWKNISTQPNDSLQKTYLNLGLISFMNQLRGVSVNLIVGNVKSDAYGIQIAGIGNLTGDRMKGVQLAGFANVSGENTFGIAAAGLANITGAESRGTFVSGLANISGEESKGAQISGLINIAGDRFGGVNIAGIGNVVGGNIKGVGIAGLANAAGENMDGIQLAGLLNVTGEDAQGIQISGVMNVTGGKSSGVQISPVNMASELRGVQIGIFNYYKEKSSGLQLGLVNANPLTKVQWMLFGGNATKINVAARFKNKLYYTILGLGTHYLDFSDKFSASTFYRAGLELPLYKELYISGDLGFQHIETFKNKGGEVPARLYALQARINMEYKITNKFGVFVTGGYGGSRYYNKSQTFDKGVIAEAGIILL